MNRDQLRFSFWSLVFILAPAHCAKAWPEGPTQLRSTRYLSASPCQQTATGSTSLARQRRLVVVYYWRVILSSVHPLLFSPLTSVPQHNTTWRQYQRGSGRFDSEMLESFSRESISRTLMDKYNQDVRQKHHHSSGVETFCSQMHTDQCRLKTEWGNPTLNDRIRSMIIPYGILKYIREDP